MLCFDAGLHAVLAGWGCGLNLGGARLCETDFGALENAFRSAFLGIPAGDLVSHGGQDDADSLYPTRSANYVREFRP